MGNLPKNAAMDPVHLFGITTKKPSPLRRHVYASKKRQLWHRYIMHFSVWKRILKKSTNLGFTSAMHTTNRQSFKKVTFPFWNDFDFQEFGLDFPERGRDFEQLPGTHIKILKPFRVSHNPRSAVIGSVTSLWPNLSVCRLVEQSVMKGREVTLPCSNRSTYCYLHIWADLEKIMGHPLFLTLPQTQT